MFISKSSDDHLVARNPTATNYNNNNHTIEESSHDRYVISQEDLHGPSRWMSSKMRFMRKMMNSDHDSKPRRDMQIVEDRFRSNEDRSTSSNNNGNFPSTIIRVCSDCNTTKTPLWRSGPRGPKVYISTSLSPYLSIDQSSYLYFQFFFSFYPISFDITSNFFFYSWCSLFAMPVA